MRTLLEQKKRLMREIDDARDKLTVLKRDITPDLNAIQQFNESIERNVQLIEMIDSHLHCQHAPMWRKK